MIFTDDNIHSMQRQHQIFNKLNWILIDISRNFFYYWNYDYKYLFYYYKYFIIKCVYNIFAYKNLYILLFIAKKKKRKWWL